MSASNYQSNPNVLAPAIDKNIFNDICRVFEIQSTVYNEKSMALYICNELDILKIPYSIDDYGNIIVTKGKSILYPCFCSHLDTVHIYKSGFNLLYFKDGGHTYLHANDNNKKAVGVGGDDKAGIYACLYLLKNIDNIKVVFFSQEEVGGIGSSNINTDFFNDCQFLCSIDRWNGHDFVSKYSGEETTSKTFKKAISPLLTKYDYSHNSGMFTDCFNVMQRGINISCFNISCGYYSHHSSDEYLDMNELYNCCLFCADLCELPERYKFKYNKKQYSLSKYWNDRELATKRGLDYDYLDYKNIPCCEYCGIELIQGEEKYCYECKRYIDSAITKDELWN